MGRFCHILGEIGKDRTCEKSLVCLPLPSALTPFSEKGGLVDFKKLDHLATVWTEYVEMEIRNKNFDRAMDVIKKATAIPRNPLGVPKMAPTPQRLFRSIRLWSLYADLEESFGTVLTCKAVYENILDLRIASPMTILNYATFLKEHNYFEESFKVNSTLLQMTYLLFRSTSVV